MAASWRGARESAGPRAFGFVAAHRVRRPSGQGRTRRPGRYFKQRLLRLDAGELDHFSEPHRFAADERVERFRRAGHGLCSLLEQHGPHAR